jgi:hypothetical protein
MDLLQSLLVEKLSLTQNKILKYSLDQVKQLNNDKDGKDSITYHMYLSLNEGLLPDDQVEYYNNVIKLMLEIEQAKYQNFINLSNSSYNVIVCNPESNILPNN